VAFPLIGAANLMSVNGVTFAASAAVIALVPFGRREASPEDYATTGILREAREGLREVWSIAGVRVVLWASTAIIVFAAMINVGELLLARDVGADDSGFAVLVAALGVGVVAGSLAGSRGGALHEMKPRYLIGLLLVATALLGMAASPNYAIALLTFFAMGVGNGLVVVHERLIFHAAIGDRLMARAFALLDMLGGWGFAAAFLGAGALITALGTRPTFALAGAGGVLVWALAAVSLRGVWQRPGVSARAAVDAGE
jgi:MFS family permease